MPEFVDKRRVCSRCDEALITTPLLYSRELHERTIFKVQLSRGKETSFDGTGEKTRGRRGDGLQLKVGTGAWSSARDREKAL